MSANSWDEVDELAEYQQAVDALSGANISEIQFGDIIDAFRPFGIHYVASDTRKLSPSRDNSATLIYTCRDTRCPSYMKFTISHNVLSRVETDWNHHHESGSRTTRTKTCSICEKTGHNSRTCPIAKAASKVTALLAEGNKVEIIAMLKRVKSQGWNLLAVLPSQMKRIVALINLDDTELVRLFFFFAPNNEVGVFGKLRLYAKIFHWDNGRTPDLRKGIDMLTRSRQSYECRANMVNALTWYAHYTTLVNGDPREILCEVWETFEALSQLRCTGGYDITCQLLKSALDEGVLILQESYDMVPYISGVVLELDRENLFSASQSLVANFMETVCVRGKIGPMHSGLLSGAWTIKTIFVDDYELTGTDGPFSSLMSTATVLYRSSDS